MDALMSAFYTTLNNDSDLSNLVSSVRFFRRPEDPQKLVEPVVIFNHASGDDEQGLHGAAVNAEIEVDIWGYQHDNIDMAPDVVRAGQRISEILVSTKLNLSSGGHCRMHEVLGFGMVPQADPDVILLRGTFRTRYWSGGRISAIEANSG